MTQTELQEAIDAAHGFIAGTERMHGHLTAEGIAYFRSQGAYVRACGQDAGCYVIRWQDERTNECNGKTLNHEGA